MEVSVSFIKSLRAHAETLGLSGLSLTTPDLSHAEAGLLEWLDAGMHGSMDYMKRTGVTRARADTLVPGATCVISVRMNYWPEDFSGTENHLNAPTHAYVARYALGRDYHKLMRKRLQMLADWMTQTLGEFSYRVFTDSAPIMEIALAEKAQLGWRGKNTLLLHREQGSAFFLGEIVCRLSFSDITAYGDASDAHCGSCKACIDVCPTQAIVAPYKLDARRCISYLTIEHRGAIPVEFRRAMGNRVYGCDDCQLACPWNKYAQKTKEADFLPRNGLENASLISLFLWSENEFNTRLQGSAIRRIGHANWLRNLSVGLGNALADSRVADAEKTKIRDALSRHLNHADVVVREHVQWALAA